MSVEHRGSALPFPGGEQLVPLATEVRFGAGTRIFRQGRRADRFWVITRGAVHLEVRVPTRRPTPVETVRAGELFGWGSLVEPYTWHFGAVAVTPVEAREFDAVTVRRMCDEDPRLGLAVTRYVAGVIARRLRSAHARLSDPYGACGTVPPPEEGWE
jgi:CRP-like cAMP-binding protein